MAILKVDYPAVLTRAAWDKNKGLAAKLAVGKTDVGAYLLAVEVAFKAGSFPDVSEFAGLDPIEYKAFETDLIKKLTKGAKAVGAALGNLKVVATAAHTAFAASKVVPKSATAYVKSILDQIEPFKNLVAQYPGVVQPLVLQAYRKRLRASSTYIAFKASAVSAPTLALKIVNMVKQVEAKPTTANVNAIFGGDGPHRMLTTTFQTWDQLAKAKLPTLAPKHWVGTAMKDLFDLPYLKEIGNEANGDASDKLTALVQLGQDEKRVVRKFCLEYSGSVLKTGAFLKAVIALAADLEKA
ncbi:MAG: hypothetical protein ABIQ99_07660 [Thermoflexales bacterium]